MWPSPFKCLMLASLQAYLLLLLLLSRLLVKMGARRKQRDFVCRASSCLAYQKRPAVWSTKSTRPTHIIHGTQLKTCHQFGDSTLNGAQTGESPNAAVILHSTQQWRSSRADRSANRRMGHHHSHACLL